MKQEFQTRHTAIGALILAIRNNGDFNDQYKAKLEADAEYLRSKLNNDVTEEEEETFLSEMDADIASLQSAVSPAETAPAGNPAQPSETKVDAEHGVQDADAAEKQETPNANPQV